MRGGQVRIDAVSYYAAALAVGLLIYISASGIATLTQDALIAVALALSGIALSQFGGLFKTDRETTESDISSSTPWIVVDLVVIFSLSYFIPRVPLSLVSVLSGNVNTAIAFNVLEAVSEELFFRGFWMNLFLSKMDPYTAIVADGILFGIYHFYVYGYSPSLILLVMMSGMVLAYSDWRTRKLAPSLISHIINNLVV